MPRFFPRYFLAFPALLALAALASPENTPGNDRKTSPAGPPQVRDIGIPVRSVNWVHLHAAADGSGRPCLLAVMGQNADNLFVLQIDPENGRWTQHVAAVAGANYPTATFLSRKGLLYIGAAYAGHLLRFDPRNATLEDLGAIHPGAATFPCRIDEDREGRIWIGSYGTADLTAYDPSSRSFTRYGRMDETDMYSYPLVEESGTVACLIRVTHPHVVAFDPRTREKRIAGPVTTQGEETIDLRRAADGKLYITSSLGNWRLEGLEAVPVEAVPPPPPGPALPDGSAFAFADRAEQIHRRLEIRRPGGETRTFGLDYEAKGNNIFCLHGGPDDCVYGSSYLPLHLFRYDPRSGALADLGRCSEATGEAYSMANLEGTIYISSYPGARVSAYDPRRPYRFGTEPGANPRDLGRIDALSYRPRSTLAGPLGRVWLASLPDYGRWGGPLSWYDPRTGEKKAYYGVAGEGSCYTLAHLEREGLIAAGTSISGGSGTRPKVDQAVLFLWDYRQEKKVWEGTPDRPVSVFNALLPGPGGKLYGTVRGHAGPELFIFDPSSRAFGPRFGLPGGDPLDLGLLEGSDGRIYGFTTSSLYAFDPSSGRIEVILAGETIDVPGPIVGREIYFATAHRVRAARIF